MLEVYKEDKSMPFCRNCGREIAEDRLYCFFCSQSQTNPQAATRETVIVQQGTNMNDALGAIFLIALLIGGIWFVAAAQVFDCPSCGNSVWVRWACSYCGYDGKVTLIHLITYRNG